MRVTVWTLVTELDTVGVSVHTSEADAIAALRVIAVDWFDDEEMAKVTDWDLVQYMCDRAYVISIDSHELEMPLEVSSLKQNAGSTYIEGDPDDDDMYYDVEFITPPEGDPDE